MQLGRAYLPALVLLTVSRFGLAEGSVTSRVSLETSGYQDSHATGVVTPTIAAGLDSPTAGWGLNGRYMVDVVSAASPDIVSTASRRWIEVRHAGSLGARYKPGLTGVALGGQVSSTPDYLALSGSGTFTQDLDDKNMTLVLSYGFGRDLIGKTGTPLSVRSNQLITHSGSIALSRVLSPSAIFTLGLDFVAERGDQSKPYRFIPLFTAANAAKIQAGASPADVVALRSAERPNEQLPLARERFAVTAKIAVRPGDYTFRLEERLYGDSWGQKASTTDVRILFDLSDRVRFWPHIRANYQTAVSFWSRAYVSNGPGDIPKVRTGDRELGNLASVDGGLGLRYALGATGKVDAWGLTITGDGVWTEFFDALYTKRRFALMSVLNLEAVF
jgi:Protein of unknown function (DUF3570)